MPERLHEERSGSATGIEDMDCRIGEPASYTEIGAKDLVDPLNHETDDFRRGIPNSELLAQLGIELSQEGLIEVLNRLTGIEGREERLSIDAVERTSRPL